jgi:cytochrome c biogenesis protein
VIGTVLKQHEPSGNYINQFGPFWAEVFGGSASLCVSRNTPKILADLRPYKENTREQSQRLKMSTALGILFFTDETYRFH